MERVHYRRVSQPGSYARSESGRASRGAFVRDEAEGYRDRMLAQCIVCGMILAVVLLARMIETDMTLRLRRNLNQALANQVSMENISAEFQKIGDYLLGRTAPEMDLPADTQDAEVFEPVTDGYNANPEAAPAEAGESPGLAEQGDYYVDEDILAELNALTAQGDESKSSVPEPSVSPEP